MDKEEKLCIKILQTLREMLDKKECIQESVSTENQFLSNQCGFRKTAVAQSLHCRLITVLLC